MQLSLLTLSLLPALILVYWLSHSAVFERAGCPVWLAFGLGLLAINAAKLNGPLVQHLLIDPMPQLRLFVPIFVFMIGAPVEEFAKLAAVIVALWLGGLHDRPLALVACGLAAGVGFAAMETYHYAEQFGLREIPIRGKGLILHGMFTGCATALLALAKTAPDHRWRHIGLAMVVPSLIHGAYNIIASVHIWFDHLDPNGPWRDAFKPPKTMYALPVHILTVMLFVILLAKLWRKVRIESAPPAQPNAGVPWLGVFQTSLGTMVGTIGMQFLLSACVGLLGMNLVKGATFVAAGALFTGLAFLLLKRGWSRLLKDGTPPPMVTARVEPA